MNAFADWLFGIILGWTRGLANAGWNLVANHSGGVSGLLGRIWLPLLIALVVIGSLLDYIVWFIRWRPLRGQRTLPAARRRMRSVQQEARALEYTDMPEDYLSMMSGWVQEEEDSMPLPEDFHAAPLPEEYAQASIAPDPYPAYENPRLAEPEISIAWRPATGIAPGSDALPGQTGPQPSMQHPGYPDEAADPISGRRRRSGRKRGVAGAFNALRDVLHRSNDAAEDANARDSAFREPVFPPEYRYDHPKPRENSEQRDR